MKQSQKLALKTVYDTSNLGEILFVQDQSWDAWSKLAKPVEFSLVTPRSPIVKQSYRTKTTALSLPSLECMPAELLARVFGDETLEKWDIVALGLCSQSLWQHMLRHVESVYRKSAAPWAGVEIACTGTCLTELPESFERDNLAMDSVISKDGPAQMFLARRFNWSAWNEFKQPETNQQDAWRSALHVHRTGAAIPNSRWPKLEEDISCSNLFPQILPNLYPNLSPESPSWILRNLTTKEYVRLCENPYRKREYIVPGLPWLRLDDVLMMRICWTLNPGPPMYLQIDSGLYRGKWAGHCFEVVMVEDASTEAGVWTDVTRELVSEARELRCLIRDGDSCAVWDWI